MATVDGGLHEVPADQQQAANQVLESSFHQIEQLTGDPNTSLTSEFSSSTLNVFSGDTNIQLPDFTIPSLVVLYLITPISIGGTTFNLRFPTFVNEERLSSLEGVTASGNGTFSILSSSYNSQRGLLLQDSPANAHALSVDGYFGSGSGVDSLTGGGASLTDTQAAFITASAEQMGASATTLASISTGLKLMSKAGGTAAADLGVEVVRLTLSDNSNFSEVGMSYTQDTLVLARLEDLPGGTLVLSGMEKALVITSGTARIDSATGTLLVGDSSNQVLISGAGNDTLVGGGGRDSLVGGGGADVFGFNTRGHYTITDFTPGVDKAYFEFDGVTTLAQVKSYLTSVTEDNGNTTFHFGSDASITLVGVSANAVLGPLLFDI